VLLKLRLGHIEGGVIDPAAVTNADALAVVPVNALAKLVDDDAVQRRRVVDLDEAAMEPDVAAAAELGGLHAIGSRRVDAPDVCARALVVDEIQFAWRLGLRASDWVCISSHTSPTSA
jgi:hypothetical protein